MAKSLDDWTREASRRFELHDKALKQAEAALAQMHGRLHRMESKAAGGDQAGAEDRAHAYTQVISLLGYGGFLALWSACNDKFTPRSFAWIGALLGVSLLVFVATELMKAHAIHMEAAGRRADYPSDRFMLWSFTVASVTGLAGGAALLAGYVGQLTGKW